MDSEEMSGADVMKEKPSWLAVYVSTGIPGRKKLLLTFISLDAQYYLRKVLVNEMICRGLWHTFEF